jgi:Asp-tRNA(Asn)/Glu-tRNA(Gln) amidotransferase A subunit family amidase
MTKELHELSAAQAARAIEVGEITAEGLAMSCLERVAERDHAVGAWAFVDRKSILERARALDLGPRRGRLHGVPLGIKDVIDTADQPTEYNSPIYVGHQPRADAACVSLLRRAGGLILGKTVTTEFANIHAGQTRNPHNLAHTPGGSSSGSAAAVADFMVPLSLGTQTAGSIIRPAAYCGVFAIKPSFGSINRAGIKFVAESLDTIGLFARTADDLALTLEVLSGRPSLEVGAAKPRIGLCRTQRWEDADSATKVHFESAAVRLVRDGVDVRDFPIPVDVEQLVDRHKLIMGYESARALAWEYTNFPDKISRDLKSRLDEGWMVSRAEYESVHRTASSCRRRLVDEMREFDFLLTLSAPGEAPASITRTGDSLFNRAWTLLGNPCVTVPFGMGLNGLPLGLQLVGAFGSDMALLAWASWMDEALKEHY